MEDPNRLGGRALMELVIAIVMGWWWCWRNCCWWCYWNWLKWQFNGRWEQYLLGWWKAKRGRSQRQGSSSSFSPPSSSLLSSSSYHCHWHTQALHLNHWERKERNFFGVSPQHLPGVVGFHISLYFVVVLCFLYNSHIFKGITSAGSYSVLQPPLPADGQLSWRFSMRCTVWWV